MKNKKIIWGVVAVIVLIVIGISFRESKPTEVVKIGVIGPFTGPRAEGGEFMKNALNIAADEINSSNNLPSVELIFEDSKYEAPVAVSAFNKLKNIDGVKYVIGPFGSSEVLAIAPIAEKSKVLLITPSAQTTEISDAGDYIFRTMHNSGQEAPIFAEFLAKRLGAEKLHFMGINTAITDSYIKNFQPAYETNGGQIGLIEKFDSKEVDFKTPLLKIKTQDPKNIFLIGTVKQEGIIMKQAGELGLNVKFFGFGTEGKEIVQVAGQVADGLIYPYSYDSSDQDKVVKNFRDKYLARTNLEPDAIAANSYDILYLFAECVKDRGDDVEKVKNCLYSTKNHDGASGTFSINEKGDAIKSIFIKTIKDGKFVRLDE